jgi:HAMP domain-containing protein/signal transduction histidine kinase/CheY-like chemotaxis protein
MGKFNWRRSQSVNNIESTVGEDKTRRIRNAKTNRGGRKASGNGRNGQSPGDTAENVADGRIDQRLKQMLKALTAATAGDFSVRLKVPASDRSMAAQIAARFNQIMAQNEAMAQEIMRVEQAVRREGRMNERASLRNVRGGWKQITATINDLIGGLVQPTTEVARVIMAVADGDLTQKMALEINGEPVKGEFLRIGTTVNAMVDQLSSFAAEVTRVAKEVGTEGNLGGQAEVKGVSGTWKDLTDNVNGLARNLTDQVRNIAKVTTAVANGDLSQKITVDVRGEVLELKNTINTMVDQLRSFAAEVARVAREVGTEGKLGGQAEVPGVSGVWKDLTDNVNFMASNLTTQVRGIVKVVSAVANGDLSQKLVVDARGEIAALADTINGMTQTLGLFAEQVTDVARTVGVEGILGAQAEVPGVAGTWKDLTDNVNLLANNLTAQVRNIAEVTTAVAKGDLSKKITVDARGEVNELKNTINTMVDQLRSFAAEVTRVAKEVGTDGKLGGQAQVRDVSGVWKDLTDNVNQMASNLTTQVRGIVQVVTAVANGDLTQKLVGVEAKGEIAALADTLNSMTKTLAIFAEQVTSVAKTVGVEGKLGAQAEVPGVAGTWKDLTDNVNLLANNLTAQVRNIAEVTTAVARGDLSKKITVVARGEVNELKNTINTMVDQLNALAAEVTRVAKEVGTEGKLGGQAEVRGVSGVWKDLTDNVNGLARNLTDQVRNIAKVTTAVANGDLSQKITVDVHGEVLELKNTINTMVDQLRSFASEVTRVAKEVGTEGKLGGQADVRDVSGTWKDLTDNVNGLARNLTDQVRNIAKVTTAVANGDLSQKITVDVRGEILELKNTINTMVDQLRSFAAEVTRVAREVGTEGKLGGQAEVRDVSGVWKDLTDNVNGLARNLTDQVRNIAEVTTAVAKGDLSKKISVDARGEVDALKNTINTMVDQLRSFAAEVTRVAREVGTEGKLGGQADVRDVSGVWKDLTDNVNLMASNLTTQVRGIVKVVTAVANGDLRQKLSVDARGEVAALAETINSMTDTLSTFAEQVSTVAREVGVEGKLGGQARVPGVAGTWKDLTDNVNFMASNLTTQVRGIVKVVTAVANGDLSQKLVGVEAKGEIAALADTINSMTDTLGTFADQVSTVAREVGIEGKLGGQAKVPGAAGTWRDLTDNVNQLAGNLTTQVRAIAEVATAVTKGDLTRSIAVEAEGEVAQLKDNINQMIINLRETTQKNNEQDWLKTNLARFSSKMQGQKNLDSLSRLIMSELTPLVSAHHGAFFLLDADGDAPVLRLANTYAYRERKGVPNRFRLGEGLVGQCALEKKTILLTQVPHDYIQISSGLGEAAPLNVIIIPILFEGEVKAVIELASFHPFSQIHPIFLDQLSESIGVVVNMIMANMRTEELLEQSQRLAQELQNQSKELTQQQDTLKRTNAALEKQALELEEKAKLLEEQNAKVEEKNREVEQARKSLEEKAEQLALVSKYKSEFLANMSHELRTPLNSLLTLAKVLSENEEGNLTAKQLEYSRSINASGADLLKLINQVLDLSKVEAGKMEVAPRDVDLNELRSFVERSFSALAHHRGLDFMIETAPDVPDQIYTDPERLQQVLKNLLDNAFKFTEKGGVRLRFAMTRGSNAVSYGAAPERNLVISVSDSGIGIPSEKQQIIFEAFQQADGTTSRKYGGTGLGLSISREIIRLLGGEISVESTPGEGSTFIVSLPLRYAPPQRPAPFRDNDKEPPVVLPAPASHGGTQTSRWLNRAAETRSEHQFRRLLVIAHETSISDGITELFGDIDNVSVRAAASPLDLTHESELGFDCVVVDARGDNDLTLAETIKNSPASRHVPVVLYVSEGLLNDRLARLSQFADSVILASEPHSMGLLLKDVIGFLQIAPERLAERARQSLARARLVGYPVEGKKALVVDDDIRNIFAVTTLLERHRMRVVYAESGQGAIEMLRQNSDVDVVLMDIMMPEMDGYETIRVMRKEPQWQQLPIIAVTARALKEDREQSLRSGASDHLAKPIDENKLIQLIALWTRPQLRAA